MEDKDFMLINYRILVLMRTLYDAEHLGFGEALIDEIEADMILLPALNVQWEAYKGVVHRETLIFRVSKESIETKEISGYDKRRDLVFREMRHRLKFYSRSPNDDVNKAATELLFVMHPFDNIPKRNLFGETAYVHKLLADLNAPVHSEAIDRIFGFREMMADLGAANGALDNLYEQRMWAMEESKSLGKRLDVRREADRKIIDIFKALNAFHLVNELTSHDAALGDTLGRIAGYVHALVRQLERNIAHRRKHPRKKDEKEDEKVETTKGSEGTAPAKTLPPAKKNGDSTATNPPPPPSVSTEVVIHTSASRKADSSRQNTS